MTDIEKFIELYKSIGIELRPMKPKELGINDSFGEQVLQLTANGTNELISGYSDFSTTLYFDNDGKFLVQMIWE
jgi:hypothetical protein